MKPQKFIKFRYSLWFYFVLFTLIIISFLWVFQLVLYENLYQRRKFEDLNEIGGELSQKLNTEGEITGNVINEWNISASSASELGIISYLASRNENDKLVIEAFYSGYYNDDQRDTDIVDLDDKKNESSQSSASQGGAQSSDEQQPNSAINPAGSKEISTTEKMETIISNAVLKMSQNYNETHLSYIYSESEGDYLVYVAPVENRFSRAISLC